MDLDASSLFYEVNEKNNNQCRHDESYSKAWHVNNTRWSSASNWTRCFRTKHSSKYSLRDSCEQGDYDEDSDSLSERRKCISSRNFKLNGDGNNNYSDDFTRRRRLWFLLVVGLLVVLILTASAVVIIVNSSSLTSLSEATVPVSDLPQSTKGEDTSEAVLSSTSDYDYTQESTSSEYEVFSIGTGTESALRDADLDDTKIKEIQRKRKISRLSWDLINRNNRHQRIPVKKNSISDRIVQINRDDDDDETELVLPPTMVYTSSDYHLRRAPGADSDFAKHLQPSSSNVPASNKKNCCKTQRYSQVVKREGCQPVTIVNRMCVGQCVSVWVPGLFASFPVCKPSRSVWRTVRLRCGEDESQIQKVKVEKIKRCSCMQIEQNDDNHEDGAERYTNIA